MKMNHSRSEVNMRKLTRKQVMLIGLLISHPDPSIGSYMGKVYDENGVKDLARIDFSLQKDGGERIDVSDAVDLTTDSNDFGSFGTDQVLHYDVTEYGPPRFDTLIPAGGTAATFSVLNPNSSSGGGGDVLLAEFAGEFGAGILAPFLNPADNIFNSTPNTQPLPPDRLNPHSGTFTDNEFLIAFEIEMVPEPSNLAVLGVKSIEPVSELGTIAGLGVVAALCIAVGRALPSNLATIGRRSPIEEGDTLQRFTPARPTTFAKFYRKDNDNFIYNGTEQLKIATEYFSLAILPELSDAEADRLEEILELAQFDDDLSSLINKIDYFVLEELKYFEPDELDRDNNQIARIKEFLVS